MTPELNYDLFIAHSHADSEWTQDLAARLETETIEGRKLNVFVYEWDVAPGDNIVLKLQDGLVSSRHFCIVMTPEALGSKFTNLEWTTAIWTDPANSNGRVIPVLRKSCDLPAFLSVFGHVDFRKDALFETAYEKLTRRLKGQPQRRGTMQFPTGIVPSLAPEAHEPDLVDETLDTNLHPVIGMPPRIYSAPTACRTFPEVIKKIKADRKERPAFILKEERLYSFEPLNDSSNPLYQAVEGDRVKEEATLAVLADQKRRDWVMHLLGAAVQEFLHAKQVYFDRDHKRYYFGVKANEARFAVDGDESLVKRDVVRRERWKSPARTASRIVCRAVELNDVVRRYEHLAAYIRFHDLGGELHLLVNPTWTFTRDGQAALPQAEMTRQAVKKMSRHGNGVVINDCRFWMSYMADLKTELVVPAGRDGGKLAGTIRIALAPLTVQLPRGILGDNKIPDNVSEPPSMTPEGEDDDGEVRE